MSAIQSDGVQQTQKIIGSGKNDSTDGEELKLRELHRELTPMVTVAVGEKLVKFPQLDLQWCDGYHDPA